MRRPGKMAKKRTGAKTLPLGGVLTPQIGARVLSPNANIDICQCGHSRTEHHGLTGHLCCAACRTCARFTWSHFSGKPVRS